MEKTSLGEQFAQVQIRLKQLVTTNDPYDRQKILASLEEFAFHAIPSVLNANSSLRHDRNSEDQYSTCNGEDDGDSSQSTPKLIQSNFEISSHTVNELSNDFLYFKSNNDNNNNDAIESEIDDKDEQRGEKKINSSLVDANCNGIPNKEDQKNEDKNQFFNMSNVTRVSRRQKLALIDKLNSQLGQLERLAYETGQLDRLPPSLLLERHAALIEHLRQRLDFDIHTNSETNEINNVFDNELSVDNIDKKTHDSLSSSTSDLRLNNVTFYTDSKTYDDNNNNNESYKENVFNLSQVVDSNCKKKISAPGHAVPASGKVAKHFSRTDSWASYTKTASPSEVSDDAIDDEVRELLMNPKLMDDQLVTQLRSQIENLERFIGLVLEQNKHLSLPILNDPCSLEKNHSSGCNSTDADSKEDAKIINKNKNEQNCKFINNQSLFKKEHSQQHNFKPSINDPSEGIISRIVKRIITVIQVLTLAQLGCANIGKEIASAARLRNLSASTTPTVMISQPKSYSNHDPSLNTESQQMPQPFVPPEDWRPLVGNVALAIDETIDLVRQFVQLLATITKNVQI